MKRPTIATGVGAGAGWQALAWALEEAADTDSRLEICHVCPPESPLASRTGTVPVGLLELADPPLARAVAAAKARLGGDRVALTVHTGRADAALLRASAHADLMVVGAGGRTTHQIAAHAQCPTVVVRPDTSPSRGPFAGHVVIGVDSSRPARAALEFGFAYAAAHRRPLAAVHVSLHGGLDLLAAEVEPWTQEYPTVVVKQAVCADRPLPGLLGAAAGARLLVVGHRGHGVLARAVLGSVAYGVLDHAAGPAVVTHAHDVAGAVFDRAASHSELIRGRP